MIAKNIFTLSLVIASLASLSNCSHKEVESNHHTIHGAGCGCGK